MAVDTLASPTPRKAWTIGLWVLQVLMAVLFAFAGGNKLVMDYAKAVAEMPQMAALSEPLIRFIGLAEVLGAIGLILPAATRVLPVLTAWAAVGLTTIMVLATAYHASRGESVVPTVVIGLICAFVAWGRFVKAPIARK